MGQDDPALEGTVRRGKIMIDRMVFPERVRISGPRTLVDSIDSLETEVVSVDNEAAELHRRVAQERAARRHIAAARRSSP